MMSGGRRVKRREKRGRVRWHDEGGGKGRVRRGERETVQGRIEGRSSRRGWTGGLGTE